MRILYFGDNGSSSNSLRRAQALERLGHDVSIFNPAEALVGLFANKWVSFVNYRTGFRFADGVFQSWLQSIINNLSNKPDICWVNSGEFFSGEFVQRLKDLGCPVILFNNDDPTGGRDKGLWSTLVKAIPYYDLCVTPRRPTENDMQRLGAKKTMRVWMSYDEIVHQPPASDETIPDAFISDVVFVGTWIKSENRHLLLRQLLDQGLRVKIWGSRWDRSPDSKLLAACLQGGPLYGRSYVEAIAGAKICLGLLSKGNRDQHTRRSVEIPFSGGLLCGERTAEHLELYRDGVEAVFWDDPEECVSQCVKLLSDDTYREKIRIAGSNRVRELKVGNEDICRQVLDAAFAG